MNESDTRLKLIDPAIMKSWDRNTQVFTEYFFTSGEVVVRGSMVTRKDKKKADYLLMYAPGIPIAIVELRIRSTPLMPVSNRGWDMPAARIPFAYSSNGKGFVEHDFLTGKERALAMDRVSHSRRNFGHDTQKLRGLNIRIARRL